MRQWVFGMIECLAAYGLLAAMLTMPCWAGDHNDSGLSGVQIVLGVAGIGVAAVAAAVVAAVAAPARWVSAWWRGKPVKVCGRCQGRGSIPVERDGHIETGICPVCGNVPGRRMAPAAREVTGKP